MLPQPASAGPVVIAQGELGRMRELAGLLARAGIASELLRPGGGKRS